LKKEKSFAKRRRFICKDIEVLLRRNKSFGKRWRFIYEDIKSFVEK